MSKKEFKEVSVKILAYNGKISMVWASGETFEGQGTYDNTWNEWDKKEN